MLDSSPIDFVHVVLTRFNVRLDNWGSVDKNSNPTLTDEWMEKRFDLFQRFCLPSIAGQTTGNFHWFVYFDAETKDPYRAKISELTKEYQFFHPIFVYGSMDLTKDFRTRFPNPPPFIITTRIDNDDCFHKESLERIQRAFVKKDHHVINFPLGYCLQLSPRCCLVEKCDHSSPFLSLVEAVRSDRPIKGVWYKNHESFEEEGGIDQISDRRYWIQVVHDTNLANQLYGGSFVNRNAIADFDILSRGQLKISPVYVYYRNLSAETIRIFGRLRFYLRNPADIGAMIQRKISCSRSNHRM